MLRLNIGQQDDEIKDIESLLENTHPCQVIELQSQQLRRLIFFAKKGIYNHKNYKQRQNPELGREISINENAEVP